MSDNNSEGSKISPDGSGSNPPVEKRSKGLRGLLWVIFVLVIGAIIGVITFLVIAPHIVVVGGPPPFFGTSPIRDLATLIAEHIILSTVSVALLLSLLIVYVRTYKKTRALFALGLAVVFLALLGEAIFTSPILQLFFVGIPESQLHYWLPDVGDVFTIIAYSIFLYLSLQ
jgi:hypothetical protein